jgi:threonyl-tRNA synthetase
MIIPVMPSANDYVKEVQAVLRKQHFHADIDVSGNTMQKKIRHHGGGRRGTECACGQLEESG